MLVVSVTAVNKSKFKICLSEDIAFICYRGDVSKFKLYEGNELSEANWRIIHDELLPKRALNRLIGLLTSRDYTRKMLGDKLRSDGYPVDIANEAVDKVVSLGYVNDLNYAGMYLHDYGNTKSLFTLKNDLKKRGVCENDIETAVLIYLEEYGDNEVIKVKKLLAKRHYDSENATYEETAKQRRYLMSKGYSYDTISKALGNNGDLFDEPF